MFVVCLSCIYCISFVSLSNVSSFFFILFLCLAYIFCVPFVYLSNVCSFSLLFFYVTVLARLSQVLLRIKIKINKIKYTLLLWLQMLRALLKDTLCMYSSSSWRCWCQLPLQFRTWFLDRSWEVGRIRLLLNLIWLFASFLIIGVFVFQCNA